MEKWLIVINNLCFCSKWMHFVDVTDDNTAIPCIVRQISVILKQFVQCMLSLLFLFLDWKKRNLKILVEVT